MKHRVFLQDTVEPEGPYGEYIGYYGILKTLARFIIPYTWIVALKGRVSRCTELATA